MTARDSRAIFSHVLIAAPIGQVAGQLPANSVAARRVHRTRFASLQFNGIKIRLTFFFRFLDGNTDKFRLGAEQKENCQRDIISFNLKGKRKFSCPSGYLLPLFF